MRRFVLFLVLLNGVLFAWFAFKGGRMLGMAMRRGLISIIQASLLLFC